VIRKATSDGPALNAVPHSVDGASIRHGDVADGREARREEDVFVLDSWVPPERREDKWRTSVSRAGAPSRGVNSFPSRRSEYDTAGEVTRAGTSRGRRQRAVSRKGTTRSGSTRQPVRYKDGLTALTRAYKGGGEVPTGSSGRTRPRPDAGGWRGVVCRSKTGLKADGALKLYPASWQRRAFRRRHERPQGRLPGFELAARAGNCEYASRLQGVPIGPIEYRGALQPRSTRGDAAANSRTIDSSWYTAGWPFVEETAWLPRQVRQHSTSTWRNTNIVVAPGVRGRVARS